MSENCKVLGCTSEAIEVESIPAPFCKHHLRKLQYRLLRCPVCCSTDWLRTSETEYCGMCMAQCGQTVEVEVIWGPLPLDDEEESPIFWKFSDRRS